MMKSAINFIVFLFVQTVLFAQVQKMNFNFSIGKQFGKMESINLFLKDSNFDKNTLLTDDSYLKSINKFEGDLTFQFVKNFNLGVYSSYSSSTVNFIHSFPVYNPDDYTTTQFKYSYDLMATNFTLGVIGSLLYNELFNFRQNEGLSKRIILTNSFMLGISSSYLRSSQVGLTPIKYELNEYNYNAVNLCGDLSMDLNFEYLKRPILSSIGLSFGYHFNKTSILRNRANQTLELSDQTSVNLDFSGIYVGANLTIGK